MLNLLVEASGEPGLYAHLHLARELDFLDYVDPDWGSRRIFPLLDWSAPDASTMWIARSFGGHLQPLAFNATKASFFQALQASNARSGSKGLAGMLVVAAMRKSTSVDLRYELDPSEVKDVLAAAAPQARHDVAWWLWRLAASPDGEGQERATRWRTRVLPTFRLLWPSDACARDVGSVRDLTRMPLECGDAFPEAVQAIIHVLAPFDLVSISALLLRDPHHRATADAHPSDFLCLLDSVINRTIRIPPDLGQALERAVRADASVIASPCYKRLLALWRSGRLGAG